MKASVVYVWTPVCKGLHGSAMNLTLTCLSLSNVNVIHGHFMHTTGSSIYYLRILRPNLTPDIPGSAYNKYPWLCI